MGAGASSISLRPFLEQGIEKWREKTHTGEWIYETGLNKLSKAIQGFMCTHIHTDTHTTKHAHVINSCYIC